MVSCNDSLTHCYPLNNGSENVHVMIGVYSLNYLYTNLLQHWCTSDWLFITSYINILRNKKAVYGVKCRECCVNVQILLKYKCKNKDLLIKQRVSWFCETYSVIVWQKSSGAERIVSSLWAEPNRLTHWKDPKFSSLVCSPSVMCSVSAHFYPIHHCRWTSRGWGGCGGGLIFQMMFHWCTYGWLPTNQKNPAKINACLTY